MNLKNFTLIFFIALLLSSCDSTTEDKKLLAEEHVFSHYTEKYPESFKGIDRDDNVYRYFSNDSKNIKNIKQAIDFLGKPSKKIRFWVNWKLKEMKSPDKYEYMELWRWEKPFDISTLFNLEGKEYDKIELFIISDFDYDTYDKVFQNIKKSPLGMVE